MPSAAAPTLPARTNRWRPLAGIAIGVALAHAFVLGLVPPGAGDGWHGGTQRALQVRRIVEPAAAPVLAAAAVGAELTAPVRALPRPVRLVAAPAPVVPRLPELLPIAISAKGLSEPDVADATPARAITVAATLPAPDAAGPPPPVYPTRMPAAALLKYELRRGMLRGEGEIAWQPGAAHYELTLQGSVLSMNVLSMQSEGGFDAAGIAPDRFVDHRFKRSAQAANFQRGTGRITFSGPSAELPIVPGTQDRMSFLLQLAAIVGAEPARYGAGAQVSMFVVGARADGDVWTFEIEGAETIDLPAGRVAGALHLHRESRRPYDTLVDVWLDPARRHLPVRLRLGTAQNDDNLDFLLVEAQLR